MTSTTTQAPTSVAAASLAIRIQGKLEHAEELLQQSIEDCSDLLEVAMERPFERFNKAIIDEVSWLGDYLGPGHAMSEFDVGNALKSVRELLELMSYADRKDG